MNNDEIVRHLQLLEKQNRYMKIILCLCLLCFILFVFGAAKSEKSSGVINANKIVLSDKQGNERIVMEASFGVSEISLKNTSGVSLMKLAVGGGLSSLILSDNKGDTRCSLASNEDSTLFRTFASGSTGSVRFELNTIGDNSMLGFSNNNGSVVLNLDEYNSFLSMQKFFAGNKTNAERILIRSDTPKESGGEIVVSNKTSEPIAHLYANEYGNGIIGAYNRRGTGKTLNSE